MTLTKMILSLMIMSLPLPLGFTAFQGFVYDNDLKFNIHSGGTHIIAGQIIIPT